jgi:hypothetical protein
VDAILIGTSQKIIHDADFKIDSIEQMYLPGTPKFVGYNYWGVAKK